MDDLIRLECISPGGGALLVDNGRPGMRHLGLGLSGAADARAAQRCHTLLGEKGDGVLLEITLNGGQWLLSGRGQFALTGADLGWRINGRPAELYSVTDFDGDYILDGSFAQRGCRAYLGIRGKWEVKKWLGSVSPGVPEVSAITAGWSIEIKTKTPTSYSSDLDVYQHCPELPLSLTVLPGPEWNQLSVDEQQQFLAPDYILEQDSNRQGLRLKTTGSPLSTQLPELISSPVLPGTLQLTPSGPILLLKDAQTIGGFPRILLLEDRQDLDRLGQLRPGNRIRFVLNE